MYAVDINGAGRQHQIRRYRHKVVSVRRLSHEREIVFKVHNARQRSIRCGLHHVVARHVAICALADVQRDLHNVFKCGIRV